ncbi:hypothetical protein P280DRAFT_471191 [Massarina eburnea CBS 473.64]|uniref:AB hydrolase-1 domain-containing protein n=1 Tax=Massarina eburnea CBS 473.64 TaxID=1395130 RepID=A0A6A6RSW5_9PLEO|nr:hypothetical protein P280DRAFT_471191 [Massarina eburnea CBS 473.64]
MNSLIAGPTKFHEDDCRLKLPANIDSGKSSEEELQPFPDAEISSIALENRNGAKIHYTYYPASPSKPLRPNPFAKSLVVFLNGLILPRSSWDNGIHTFLEKRITAQLPYPALLSYDRFGQGDSDRDPNDQGDPPCHGHDCVSAVHDLKQFTLQIWKEHLTASNPVNFPALIFVCNSIGCAIARLFAQAYPGTVLGLLFLDSVMANSDFVSMWPDPDAENFDPTTLPPGVSEKDVRDTREKYRVMFHPSVPNMEGLTRRNLATLLPDAHLPVLEGYNGEGPFLTVAGHDWETFADQSFTGSLHTPRLLTMTYANPAWQKYNEGLVWITEGAKAIGPIIAVGCGHFVQKDGPGFVSDELVSLLDRVVNRVEQVSERDGVGE